MTGFKRDENRIPVIGAVSSVDSTTLVQLEAEPTEKALHVFIKGTDVATGGTSALDDADFTAGTTPGTPVMGIYESTPTTPTDGDMGVVGITVNREVKTVDTNLITIIKAEDAAHSTGDKGIMALAVENEDGADLSTGDKDYTPIAVTKEGNIIVKQEGTIAVTESTPLTGFATSAGQLADGHNVVVTSITAGTNVLGKVRLVSASGDELSEDTDDSLQVTIVADDVGIGGGTQYAEDAGHSTGDTGTMALIVRDDALAANAGTNADLDYMPARGDNFGALWVTLTDAAGAGVDASSIGGGVQYAEDAAHASGNTGTMALAVRNDAGSALAADGDYIPLITNASGALSVDVLAGGVLESLVDGLETDTGNIVTAIQLLDNAVDGSYLNVNVNAAGTDLTMNAGVLTAQTQRVTLATDGEVNNFLGTIDADTGNIATYTTGIETAVELIDDTVYVDDADWTDSTSKHLLVGGLYQSAPQTITDGDVAPFNTTVNGALHTAVQNTVTVTESTPLTGFATSALQLADGHNVTIDNASTDEVYVRGGGTAGSPTDGEVVVIQGIAGADAVTVALDTTDNAVLDAIAASLEILDDWDDTNYANVNLNIAGTDVSANAGVLTAQTLRVTLATDGEANNFLGTIDADTSNIATYTSGAETALETMDGAIVGPGEPTIDSFTQFAINLNAGANQVLVSSAASKQIWVYGFGFTLSVAGTVSFQDEDDAAITGIMDFAANSGMGIPCSGNFSMPIWKLGTDKDLEVDVVTAAIDGWISYAIVSV